MNMTCKSVAVPVLVLGVCLWMLPGAAQDSSAVWALQAKTAAGLAKAPAEQVAKVVEAYTASRTSLNQAAQAQGAGEGRDRFAARRQAAEAERTKLETALKGVLTAEQAAKAMETLGTFNRRWDGMVEALVAMKLDEKVMGEAMNLVAGYVADTGAAGRSATSREDFQAVRTKMQARKQQLDGELGKILSAEQMTAWNQATAERSRGGRGGARGEGRGEGRGREERENDNR